MDKIIIEDLEVYFQVGVPDSERAQPQRLLLSLELGFDVRVAAATDDLRHTIDYQAIAQRLRRLGEGRSWKLIETLAVDLAKLIMAEFQARLVTVTVKKFVLPDTRFVAVQVTRSPPTA